MPASPKIDLSEGNDVKKKAEALGLPFINLTGKTIPNDVLREIPEESAIFYQIIPFAKDEKVLKVGLVDPNDLQAQEALRFITLRSGLKPEIHLISQNDFDDIIKQYRNLKEEVGVALQQLKKEVAREKEGVDEEKKEARRVGVEAPISKIVAVMLKYAQDGRASDIHIEPFEKDLKIRYRVDGVLFTSLVFTAILIIIFTAAEIAFLFNGSFNLLFRNYFRIIFYLCSFSSIINIDTFYSFQT